MAKVLFCVLLLQKAFAWIRMWRMTEKMDALFLIALIVVFNVRQQECSAVPGCWRLFGAALASCLLLFPVLWPLCISWPSRRSEELVRVSEPSRGRGPPEPVRLSLPSAELDLGDIAPRGPSGIVLAGCVGDFSMAGGGIGGGGRSVRKQIKKHVIVNVWRYLMSV